jgi:hypothetical protein
VEYTYQLLFFVKWSAQEAQIAEKNSWITYIRRFKKNLDYQLVMAMYNYFPRYKCTGCRCWPGMKRAGRNINMQSIWSRVAMLRGDATGREQ